MLCTATDSLAGVKCFTAIGLNVLIAAVILVIILGFVLSVVGSIRNNINKERKDYD